MDHPTDSVEDSPPPHSTGPAWSLNRTTETSVLRPVAILAERRGLFAGIVVTVMAASIGLALVLPTRYAATTQFVPERGATGLPSGLAGLTAQLGFNLSNPQAEQSPLFYASILQDAAILQRVLAAAVDTGGGTARILDILHVRADAARERIELGVEKLGKITDVRVDLRTSIVSLTVKWKNPITSAAIANTFLQELQEFNLAQRRSTAGALRQFLEQRLNTSRNDLRAAEESLRVFLERNRRTDDSPELQFRQQRLQRVVDMKVRVVESLEQEYEQARIREVNSTPVISVIRQAEPPARRSEPRRKRIVIAGSVLALLLGAVIAFGADYLERARQRSDPDFIALRSALSGFRQSGQRRAHERTQ